MLQIDQLGTGIRGDRSGTLPEVLDPPQYGTRVPSRGWLTDTLGPETIPQLATIITALRSAAGVKVMVSDGAVGKFFLTHSTSLRSSRIDSPASRSDDLEALPAGSVLTVECSLSVEKPS